MPQTCLIVRLLLLVLLVWKRIDAGAEHCIAEDWPCCAGRAKVALILTHACSRQG